MSKKIVLSADEKTASVADATVSDIFTTLFDGSAAVTGIYGFLQRGGLFAAGMVTQNYRNGRGLNIFE